MEMWRCAILLNDSGAVILILLLRHQAMWQYRTGCKEGELGRAAANIGILIILLVQLQGSKES